jgi:hypothetical protein
MVRKMDLFPSSGEGETDAYSVESLRTLRKGCPVIEISSF